MHLFWRFTLRRLARKRLYTTLNILGLTLGFTCCLLMYLYISEEVSYDTFHPQGDRTYRVSQSNIWVDSPIPFAATGPGVRFALQEIPEVEHVVRVHTPGEAWVQPVNDLENRKAFKEPKVLAADSNFFEVFGFTLITGNPHKILDAPYSTILTQQMAQKYFGQENPIGKILRIDFGRGFREYLVKGVLAPTPHPSHIQFDVLVSMTSFPAVKDRSWSWVWTTFVTYVTLQEGIQPESLQEKLRALPPKYALKTLEWVMGYDSYEAFKASGKSWDLYLDPISDIYLHSKGSSNRVGPIGDIRYVYAFAAIAALILLLSCINYINLTTAQALDSIQEVGVQKTLGASSSHLVLQALYESVFISGIAFLLGILVSDLLLVPFNGLTGKNLSLVDFWNPLFIGGAFLFALMLGLVAGGYPGWHLAHLASGNLIKKSFTGGKKSSFIRNSLVTFQFVISISLIICTAFVYKQIHHLSAKDIGFAKEQVVVIPNGEVLGEKLELFAERINNFPGVQHAGLSDATPPAVFNSDYFTPLESSQADLPIAYIHVDEFYVPALGLSLLAGRNFSRTYGTDSTKFLLNETAARQMGWEVDPQKGWEAYLGKQIQYPGDDAHTYTCVGILKDFHFWSLHNPIEPLMLLYQGSGIFSPSQRFLSVQLAGIQADNFQHTLDQIQGTWEEMAPEIPFTTTFMDATFEQAFMAEQRLSKVLGIFSLVAICIACLGLLGLSAYAVEKRTKEIGIRKILGASTRNIVQLIGKTYIPLIALAFLLASPLGYVLMSWWLESYPYRTPLSWSIFIFAGLVALLIAALTVSLYSLRAARQSPIVALRDE